MYLVCVWQSGFHVVYERERERERERELDSLSM